MSEPASDDDDAALFKNRARASSFGQNAQRYDETRPRYPDAFVDDLVAGGATTVLDVGCGTGLLGRSFLERGLAVTGVEPDPQMAAIAERHGLAVEVATFETWAARDRTFDLLVAGQAWHWVDPVPGAHKAAAVLRSGGTCAHAWNVGAFDADLRAEIDEVYDRLASDALPLVPHRRERSTERSDSEQAFVDTGSFDGPDLASYPWDETYTTAAWLSQLETHSDHALMAPDDRATLLAALGEVLDARGGSFVMHYDCEVTRFTRR